MNSDLPDDTGQRILSRDSCIQLHKSTDELEHIFKDVQSCDGVFTTFSDKLPQPELQ